jgi:fatty-acyl-CoA synthase
MKCTGVVDAVVYGVPVAGAEGRAGMAAVVGDDAFSLQALSTHASAALPPFARPLFIRLCRSIPNTATFKLRQEDLAREGLDIKNGSDSLWFNDPATGRVVPCDSGVLSSIAAGALRV